MPILQRELESAVSSVVRVRRARWRVVDVRAFEACCVITLLGLSPPHAGVTRRVLAPFDAIEPIERSPRLHRVGLAAWRRACRALVAADTPPGCLIAARLARFDLLPYQLEPALAILRGRGARVLLADEVGLGKTIQAGLIVAELRAQGLADRALVLAPAGLREQWARELTDRFAIDATVVDAASLRRRASTLAVGTNPWSTIATAIASTDYVKRPEVLPAAAEAAWDVVVVDEAHGVAGDSDRRAAVGALAARAPFVVLLTATPHSGDRRAFASLCGTGAIEAPDADRLIVFRRARTEVGMASMRRVRTLLVRPTADETRVHRLLARYGEGVRAERGGDRLALAVLQKRACSSPWSLAESVDRRLAALANPDHAGEQLALPIGDPDGELTPEDEPPPWPAGLALADSRRDGRMLAALADAARLAARRESKLAALERLLRRAGEPAVVFTEYRDTLIHVFNRLQASTPVAVLHGGLGRDARSAALAAFSRGDARVLLATDAAGEGINLQHAARLVVNLELPWSPTRLEQRIGRVDRIGQRRTVHAVHLVSPEERRLLARLADRVARARVDIAGADSLGRGDGGTLPPSEGAARLLAVADLRSEATAEAARLIRARAVSRAEDETFRLWVESERPCVASARRGRLRRQLGRRLLFVYRLAGEDQGCRPFGSRVLALAVSLADSAAAIVRPADADAWQQAIEPLLQQHLDAALASWAGAVEDTARACGAIWLRRLRAIASSMATQDAAAFQPGLFDRRAEREHLRRAARRDEARRAFGERAAALERASVVRVRAELRLVLLP